MDEGIRLIAVLVGGYVLGCFCSAYYLVLWKTGQDIRTLHSGTAGARNAGRVLGKTGFVLALSIDIVKGVLAVLIARWILPCNSLSEMLGFTGAVIGHVLPVQLSFKGGKGISVAVGSIGIINPFLLAVLATVAGVVLLVMRRTSQCAVIAVALLPPVAWLLCDDLVQKVGFTFVAVVVLFFHRKNIRDIVRTYTIGENG